MGRENYSKQAHQQEVSDRLALIARMIDNRSLIRSMVKGEMTVEQMNQEAAEINSKPVVDAIDGQTDTLSKNRILDQVDMSSYMMSLFKNLQNIRDEVKKSQNRDNPLDLGEITKFFQDQTQSLQSVFESFKNSNAIERTKLEEGIGSIVDMLGNINQANEASTSETKDTVAKLVAESANQYDQLIQAMELLNPPSLDPAVEKGVKRAVQDNKNKLQAILSMKVRQTPGANNRTGVQVKEVKEIFSNLKDITLAVLKGDPNPEEIFEVSEKLLEAAALIKAADKTNGLSPDFQGKITSVKAILDQLNVPDKDDDIDIPRSTKKSRAAAKKNKKKVEGKGFKKPINVFTKATSPTSISPAEFVELQTAGMTGKGMGVVSFDVGKKQSKFTSPVIKDGWFGPLKIDMDKLYSGKLIAKHGKKPVLTRNIDETTLELVTKRYSAKKDYSDNAWNILASLVHLSGIKLSPGAKANKIKPFIEKIISGDKVIKPRKTPAPSKKKTTGKGIFYYKNKQQLKDRKKVLTGSVHSGNNNEEIKEEISEIDTILNKP